MGRPPKAAADKQSIGYRLMLNEREREALETLAKKHGMEAAQWLRQKAIYEPLAEAGEELQ